MTDALLVAIIANLVILGHELRAIRAAIDRQSKTMDLWNRSGLPPSRVNGE